VGREDTGGAFPPELLERIAQLEEIDVETTGRRSGEPRRATVWVVVEGGAPFVRSEFGERGRWYQNALAEPRVALWVEGKRIDAEASRPTDPAVLRRVSDAIRTKYGHHDSFESMLRPDVEPTTLRLDAR
jgi:deazaflavin-dependent oxidoreductase (nitroreductase family)